MSSHPDTVQPADAPRIPPGVEYHRVLAGDRRRIGRGILAIALLIIGMNVFTYGFAIAATLAETALGVGGPGTYGPLLHAAGMASVAMLIPWSMLIQRWLYGVRGASLHSVLSRFRFDLLGRAIVVAGPIWVLALSLQYVVPLPDTAWSYSDVLLFLIATLLLTPLQAAGEEYGFRGLVFRVAGSWTRGARAGLVVGIVVSALAFMLVHVATDLWLNVWYLLFSVATALITWRTGGIEIAIVLHALYNTLSFAIEAALRVDHAAVVTDRGEGSADASIFVLMAIMVVTTIVVWLRTRRTGPATTPPAAVVPSPAER